MNAHPPITFDTKPRKARLLLVGTEGLDQWPGLPGFEIVGIVEAFGEWPSGKPANLHAQLQPVPLLRSLEEALSLASPDAACVSVPGGRKTDFDVLERLLREPIDVLAKKLRLNGMDDVDRLAAQSAKGPGRLFVGEHYRYMASVRELKRLLDEGKLGAVEQITWRCRLPYECYDWMKAYRHLALEDLAYHHFSVLHDLFGFDPVRLYAQSFEPVFSRAGTRTIASVLAETADYHLNYETVWCSKRKPFSYLGELTVEGAEGTAVLTDDALYRYSVLGRKRSVRCSAPQYDGMWGVLSHWLDAFGQHASSQPPSTLSEETPFSAWRPYTFEEFEPVLRAVYRAVESAETHAVK